MRMSGMPVHVSHNLPWTDVSHDIVQVNFKHSRNHREWKRLVKQRRKLAKTKRRQDAYFINGTLFVSPEMMRAFKEDKDLFW